MIVETLGARLRHNASTYGDKAVIVTADDRISHNELDHRSRQLAAGLVGAGVGRSSRVGLMAPNGIDWAVTAAAVMRVGATLVPLSTLLRAPELSQQLDLASVTHLIPTREFRGRRYLEEIDQIESPPSLLEVWPLDELPAKPVASDVVEALEAAVFPAHDLVLMFTSGSRGAPKGVVHTHGGSLLATASGLASRCIGHDDRLYIPMPFFWTGGFNGGLLSAIVAGATLLTEAIPEPAATLALLERERATLFRGWPDQAAKLAADPTFASADLRSLGPGSLGPVLPAAVRPAVGARANLFGMTETAGPYCGDRLDTDLPADKFGSCGRPFTGIDVRIGEAGEIQLRGPRVMRTIVGRLRESIFDPDGYYRTGDVGSLDADGYLWYDGRLDDMVKISGATVFPGEVESALRTIDGVRQAHVTDVTIDGSTQIAAVVITDLVIDEVASAAAAKLSSFKVPTLWLTAPSTDLIPLSASSKIDKAALQQLITRDGSRAMKKK